jgi:imidazoleglycerol-phosphate dehydratase
MAEQPRIASLERNTSESQISVTINLDGTGKADIETDNGML